MTDGVQQGMTIPKPTCIRPRQLGRAQPPGAGPRPVAGRRGAAQARAGVSPPGSTSGPQGPAASAPAAQAGAGRDGARGPAAEGVPAPRDAAPAGTGAGCATGGEPVPAEDGRPAGMYRGTAREALDAALRDVPLGDRDRQFLRRLVHWDKRNALAVADLLWRARLAGRDEAALTARQLDVVLSALADAASYRQSGIAMLGCWGCENIPGGRCAEHARDGDRARSYAEAAAALAARAGRAPTAPAAGLPEPTDIAGYRSRKPVAS
ncbi:MAG: hypothetical protein ACLQDY_26585 [Streptosporangiaceae bacterium]